MCPDPTNIKSLKLAETEVADSVRNGEFQISDIDPKKFHKYQKRRAARKLAADTKD